MQPITKFSGEYAFLSNFYWLGRLTMLDGLSYPTAEHAFQAAKTLNMDLRRKIAAQPSPGQAKRWGGHLDLRPDWDALRQEVMLEVLRAKFQQHPALAQQLLATGEALLVEGNTWGDVYWGVCRGHGRNHLGQLLMRVRSDLRRVLGP